ncbi:hypothetical protein [Comamonas aquatica]|uniref:hypothetical protein n=1 Tax=Comamonas aquatica TaxID=225991 RepID=UPI00244C1CD5|nr:hypothetical protein [Comamonas aquatica]MDH1814048.1 hypothetical protein [Comamonas aquatica]
MSESTEFLFCIEPVPFKVAYKKLKSKLWMGYGDNHISSGRMSTFYSNLTGRGFKITPWIDKGKTHVIGVLVKINAPCCLLANNAFIHNMPYESAKAALLFLQEALHSLDASEEYIKKFKLENAFIKKFDLSFLLKLESIDHSVEKRNELEDRINVIYHFLAYKYRQPFGEGYDKTAYLNYVNYPSLRAYIKWHDIERNTRDYLPRVKCDLDPKIKEKIYRLSQKGLRIELTLRDTYLKKKYPEMLNVMAWKDVEKSQKVIAEVFQTFRGMLRLDDDLRHNKHRPSDFAKLDQSTQDFLTKYYAGEEESILSSMTKNQRYELKKKILAKARIDVSIPWKYHKQLKAMDWLVQPKDPVLSKKHRELWSYVYNRENLPVLLEKAEMAGVTAAYKSKVEKGLQTSDISDLMGDLPTTKPVLPKPYRGIGSLKIPMLVNMAPD